MIFNSQNNNSLPTSLMGVDIDPKILAFRENVINNSDAFEELNEKLKELQAQAQASLGTFQESDFQELENVNDSTLVNLQNLREVNLNKFNLSVEDADTLILKRKGFFNLFSDPIMIRMSGIDAPETAGHENDPMEMIRIWQSQPYGEKATESLRRLIEVVEDEEDKPVRLFVDAKNQTYGRSLGALVSGEGLNLNLMLAREGMVSALPFGKRSEDIINREAIQEAQEYAQEHEYGIWKLARYKAIAESTSKIGQPITYNTFTEINRLGRNLNLGAYGSFLESLGEEERELTPEEKQTSRRLGWSLAKTHGPERRKWAIRRMQKFNRVSTDAVGLGNRSAHNASKKHSRFPTTGQ